MTAPLGMKESYEQEPRKGECVSCDYETTLKAYEPAHHRREHALEEAQKEHNRDDPDGAYFDWYCNICASTFAGNAHSYPGQYECASLYATVAHVGNMILDEIRKIPR